MQLEPYISPRKTESRIKKKNALIKCYATRSQELDLRRANSQELAQFQIE